MSLVVLYHRVWLLYGTIIQQTMISAVVLTKNSEETLEKCLASLSWCDEILVIDDASSDNTIMLAKKSGAKVIEHSLSGDFSLQRNFALEKTKGDWVFFVDSDEVVTGGLRDEILHAVNNKNTSFSGFRILRRDVLWEKEIMHGENGKTWLIRLARKNVGTWEGKVHETWNIGGSIGRLQNILYHYPHPTLTEFLSEINFYSTLRAEELWVRKVPVRWYQIILYPKAKFFQNYVFKLGFLDGTRGFILALLMSFHSFLVRGKLWQFQKSN